MGKSGNRRECHIWVQSLWYLSIQSSGHSRTFFLISDASISAASATKALPSTSNHSNLTPGPNKAQPSTSFSPGHTNMGVSDMSTDSQTSNEASEVSLNLEEKETPSKFLREDNPIPLIPNTIPKRKQHALELTSPENRVKRRVFSEKKKQAQDKKDKRKKPSENEKKLGGKPALNKLKENKMYQVRLRRKLNHILAPLKTYLMTLMITALNVANTTTPPNLRMPNEYKRKTNRGFRTTGIWPLNTEIFREEEFLPSQVTDRALPPTVLVQEDSVVQTNDPEVPRTSREAERTPSPPIKDSLYYNPTVSNTNANAEVSCTPTILSSNQDDAPTPDSLYPMPSTSKVSITSSAIKIPVTKPPVTLGEIPGSGESEVQSQDDQDSSSDFEDDTRPKLFFQEEINDFLRDLDVPKDAAELLGTRLNDKNLLLPGEPLSWFRHPEKNFLPYFTNKDQFTSPFVLKNKLLNDKHDPTYFYMHYLSLLRVRPRKKLIPNL
ncbi:unnamed protein product [Acanthoscelides obtectus]|uniref:Uncharacterized protein n=1 Tax=Acanthoscelides obtectus TaxID=200917 RepID=A0A9P0JWA7_ACAOB|nr:unnamed protein product [Acanthoscelides obtectus]CAK1623795.1 hypothetical protein AOBTE_LOCUS2189 [Acanthoscelides obtectus]